ncbi:MAG: hypothetical protein ACLTXL_12420 [Clostridia bacterium]
MDLEERRDLLNEKMAEQIEILPGQSLDEAQIGWTSKHVKEYLSRRRKAYITTSSDPDTVIITTSNMMFTMDKKKDYVHRISVYDDFKGRFRGVGLGSSVQDVLNVTGEIKDDGGVYVYVIPGYPGICFEASEEGVDSMMRPIICFSIVDEAYYQ